MSLICAVVLLLSSYAAVLAHEPIVNGTCTGPAYSVYTDALEIPSNKFSLAARRWSTAMGPVFWLKYKATAGESLYLGAGSGSAVANAALRVKLWAFGPGLPRKYSPRSFKVDVPWQPDFKFNFLQSPASVSNCNWLTTANAKGSNNVTSYNGVTRCGSLNPATGMGFFPMLDYAWVAPADGMYYFAFHLTKLVNAGWYVSTGSLVHAHDENHVLPQPPMGNAPDINTASPNLTVTNAIYGVSRKYIQTFSIL